MMNLLNGTQQMKIFLALRWKTDSIYCQFAKRNCEES